MPDNNASQILTNSEFIREFYDNSQSNIISINDDKLKVILLEHKETMTKNSNYLTPLMLLISLILTFCTAEFKDFITISGKSWQGFYLFGCLGTLVWLIIELLRIKKIVSIDNLISKIKHPNN